MTCYINLAKFFCWSILAVLLISQEGVAKKRYCGKELTDVLEVACEYGYNTLISQRKRSVTLPAYDIGSEAEHYIISSPSDRSSIFMEKMFGDAANLMTKTRRRRHGIYEECCLNPCRYDELQSYCL